MDLAGGTCMAQQRLGSGRPLGGAVGTSRQLLLGPRAGGAWQGRTAEAKRGAADVCRAGGGCGAGCQRPGVRVTSSKMLQ